MLFYVKLDGEAEKEPREWKKILEKMPVVSDLKPREQGWGSLSDRSERVHPENPKHPVGSTLTPDLQPSLETSLHNFSPQAQSLT